MQKVVGIVRNRIARSELFVVWGLVSWCLWVAIASFISPYPFDIRSPYLLSTAGLVVGVLVGALLRDRWFRGGGISFLMVLVVVTAISLPIYANASAAVGGLFVALAGLAALDGRANLQYESPPDDARVDLKYRARWQTIVVILTGCTGLYLALGSQAAILLALPVVVTAALVVWKQEGPPKRLPAVIGFLVVATAASAVIFLGSRSTWPGWLADSGSLSGARHTLWSDALSLWATQPLVGAGPGAFTPSSELASEVPSLASVHSLFLQAGSELGAIGVLLLGFLLVGGLLFAARGSRPAVLIAMSAWTALAVHSTIDHLEDFPVVAVMGGIVLGWSGFGTRSTGSRG